VTVLARFKQFTKYQEFWVRSTVEQAAKATELREIKGEGIVCTTKTFNSIYFQYIEASSTT
jgi:hypothetical protein